MKIKGSTPITDGIVYFHCPACKTEHYVHTKTKNHCGTLWAFDGNLMFPTFTPSINVRWGIHAELTSEQRNQLNEIHRDVDLKELSGICHSTITAGMIRFEKESTHDLRGKTVELPDLGWSNLEEIKK